MRHSAGARGHRLSERRREPGVTGTTPTGGFRVRAELGWAVLILALTAALALRYYPAAVPDRSAWAHWSMALASVVLLLASVLLHELAHSVVAERFGVRSRGITLLLLGARTEMSGMLPHPFAEALMAIAGPAANVVLALSCAAVLRLTTSLGAELPTAVLAFGMLANALLALINVMPVYPLDGGRIVRAILWLRTGTLPEATRQAGLIGILVSTVVAAGGVTLYVAGRPIEGVLAFSIGVYLYVRARSAMRATRQR